MLSAPPGAQGPAPVTSTQLQVAASCTGECQKSGPIGFAVILVLCVLCYFLFKSMSKHLRKVREEFPGTPGAPTPGIGIPAGSDPAPTNPPPADASAAAAAPDAPRPDAVDADATLPDATLPDALPPSPMPPDAAPPGLTATDAPVADAVPPTTP